MKSLLEELSGVLVRHLQEPQVSIDVVYFNSLEDAKALQSGHALPGPDTRYVGIKTGDLPRTILPFASFPPETRHRYAVGRNGEVFVLPEHETDLHPNLHLELHPDFRIVEAVWRGADLLRVEVV